jgi:hypothetical protein
MKFQALIVFVCLLMVAPAAHTADLLETIAIAAPSALRKRKLTLAAEADWRARHAVPIDF